MTRGIWVCHECGHKVRTLIYKPLKRCPKCGAEHEIIGWIKKLHRVHTIPIYKSVKEPIEKIEIVSPHAMLCGNEQVVYMCNTKELYEYLKKKFKGKNVKVECC